ncbi:MAG: UDP-glucose 4-epimerase GalE [Candidatus Limnocylindrales bacterium]
MRVLVTGGAGYVGSVTVERLIDTGHEVAILDSMFRGHKGAIADGATLVTADIGDATAVEAALRDNGIEAVLHCAGLAQVAESVVNPQIYFRDNVGGGLLLLDAMIAAGVQRIVFSSSASVYGTPIHTPIDEDHPNKPVNPYGETKRAFESTLQWYAGAYGLAAVSLRYFNACGATVTRGEDHHPETHLIPNILRGALGGPQVKIFGTDYDTADGTCIRDYIHVLDLADAHIAALEMTATSSGKHEYCNLGSGSGFSVLDVLKAAESVVGGSIPHEFGPRRAGDPAVLVASNSKAREMLGWEPRRGTLGEMIGSAWNWHQGNPHGYED